MVTRPGKSSRGQSLADLFAADTGAAVLRVLQEAAASLTAGEVKAALQAGGVARIEADKAWPLVQRSIRDHEHVVVEPGHRYRWTPPVPAVSPAEALELIVAGRLAAAKKAELAGIVRDALVGVPPGPEMAARQRQAELDEVRALAELAIEVEELSANQASARAMIHRVRARVKLAHLEPIGRAGEETTFDRKRHKPIGPPIRDGAPVIVVRPGYVWKASTEDVLIAKAVVQDRS